MGGRLQVYFLVTLKKKVYWS